MKRKIRALTSYDYHDHDPVVDEMRTMWQQSGLRLSKIAELSGLSISTLHRWFIKVDIDSPQHRSVAAFKRALGYDTRDYQTDKLTSVSQIRRGARFIDVKWRGKVIRFPGPGARHPSAVTQ